VVQDPEASVDGGEYSEEELESLAVNLANRPPSDTEADFLDKEESKVGSFWLWLTRLTAISNLLCTKSISSADLPVSAD
jgi:hypothetical protein